MSGSMSGLDVTTLNLRNFEPLLTEFGPSLLKSFMVCSLSSGKVSDDDVEVSRDATEESGKFFEELRR